MTTDRPPEALKILDKRLARSGLSKKGASSECFKIESEGLRKKKTQSNLDTPKTSISKNVSAPKLVDTLKKSNPLKAAQNFPTVKQWLQSCADNLERGCNGFDYKALEAPFAKNSIK